MTDEAFLASWHPIAKHLHALEEWYLTERVRKDGHPQPQGEELELLRGDLDAICELCISATHKQRATIFEQLSGTWLLPNHLERLIRLPADLNARTEVATSLRHALAAATLLFNSVVLRNKSESLEHGDCYMPLGRVWIAARQRGVDPGPYFREAAQWSADEGYSSAVRRFLLRFHESAYFRADVSPYLPVSP